MEFVGEIGGVRYVNNSMCTNPAAVEASLSAVGGPLVAIAGGVHKSGELLPLAESLKKWSRRVVLIGEARNALADALTGLNYTDFDVEGSKDLAHAVETAKTTTKPGETVILAPGCASFDMFANFEARGQAFRDAVKTLTTEGAK
jgi:UDP-N-acetylmuramoylalanine--D-glutamate ligase